MVSPREFGNSQVEESFFEALPRTMLLQGVRHNDDTRRQTWGLGALSALRLFLLALVMALVGCGERIVGWPTKGADLIPTVGSTTPQRSSTDVALNTAITVTFSEEMASSSISSQTFTLADPTSTVAGEVLLSGVTAVFIPAENLSGNTTFTARVTTGAMDLTGNPPAEDYEWRFTTGEDQDSNPPQVSSTTPSSGALEVANNAPISATFTEAMDPHTITTTSFTLLAGTTPVLGEVHYVGITALFSPMVDLEGDTTYTARITSDASDLAGNEMMADYSWTFTTGTDQDTTRPMVSSTTPVAGLTEVHLNTSIVATFSEAMDPSTVTTSSFTLSRGATPVAGAVTYSGVSGVFLPAASLEADTLYTASLSSTLTDLAGNTLAGDYEWTFTTGTDTDERSPEVSFTNPAHGATGVASNTILCAAFSEEMDPLTISSATFTLREGKSTLTGTVVYVGVTACFDPAMDLATASTFTAMISSDVTDLAGNAMADDFEWSFTTGLATDTTAPQVNYTVPLNEALNVAFNALISAIFTESMDPLTISTATFTLMDGTNAVSGTVIYIGVTATFYITENLDADTTYTATITEGARDLAGVPMAADYIWSFTTGPVADIEEPRVTSTVPIDDATSVTFDGSITAVFSEAMDPLTITTANFTVQQLDTRVIGTVTYSGVTATFNPNVSLLADTTYSATITTAAQDLAGNSLVRDYVWNFSTGATPDTTSPWVISSIPADDETSVVLDTGVSVTFNEAMDPQTITTATFSLMDGTTRVSGVVTQIGPTALFIATRDLNAETEYIGLITIGARDLAGNALEDAYVWSFTTGLAPDETPPTVILTSPECGDGDVTIDRTVNATFSEAMNPLTISTANFELAGPGGSEVTGTVTYNAFSRIAAFTPADDLLASSVYVAMVRSRVTDLAGNEMIDGP